MYNKENEQYLDFLTYVLIHAASADHEIGDREADLIKRKASTKEYEDVLKYYRTHDPEQRVSYMKKMKEKWLHTDDSKAAVIKNVQEITGADLVLNKEEKQAYKELKSILL